MVKYLVGSRAECLNQIRPGKICGAHLAAGKTFCPVCGEKTTTRRIDPLYEIDFYELVRLPRMRRTWVT